MSQRGSKRVWGVLWAGVPLVWGALAFGGAAPAGPAGATPDPSHPVHGEPPRRAYGPPLSGTHEPGRSRYRGPAHPSQVWAYQTGGPVTGQVAVDGRGRLYVGSHDGYLYALDAAGALRFKRKVAPDVPRDRIWAAPWTDAEDQVYVGSDAGVLASFDEVGALRFRLSLPGPVDRAPAPLPGGRLVVVSGNVLTTLSTSGEILGTYAVGGKLFSHPAVDAEGRVFVGGQDDKLHVLGPDGTLDYSFEAGADIDGGPVVGEDGRVYFGADDGRIRALGEAGSLRWVVLLDGHVRAPLALGPAGDVVAATLGPRPRVVSLCARHGVMRWEFAMEPTDSPERGVVSGPLLDVRGDVYVGSHDGGLYGLRGTNGERRFRFSTGGQVRSTPTLLEDGTLVFGSDDGWVYALRDTP